jgi:hypothetical protein
MSTRGRYAAAVASLLLAFTVAVVSVGQSQNPSSESRTTTHPADQKSGFDIDFRDALLVWERNDGKVTLRSHDRDSTSPITGTPTCTALRKPCPRKSSGKITPLTLFNGWSLEEKVDGSTLHFEVRGPRHGVIQVLGENADARVTPDRSWAPWTRGKWDFSILGTADDLARLRILNDNVFDKSFNHPDIQQVSPITDPGNSCWVEVPCPAPKK